MHLTEDEKLEIAEMYKSGKYYLKEIAEWMGCDYTTARRYRNYKSKKQVEPMLNIKKVRLSKKLTQEELSEKTDISLRTYQQYEQGRRDIDGCHLSVLVSIAIVLECKISDVLNDKDLITLCKRLGI